MICQRNVANHWPTMSLKNPCLMATLNISAIHPIKSLFCKWSIFCRSQLHKTQDVGQYRGERGQLNQQASWTILNFPEGSVCNGTCLDSSGVWSNFRHFHLNIIQNTWLANKQRFCVFARKSEFIKINFEYSWYQ